MDNELKDEANFFNDQIEDRLGHGHIPDIRNCGRCEYFYNNVWRDKEFAKLYFGEVVERAVNSISTHLKKNPRILEVGCGPGHVSLELARHKFEVKGIDLSDSCIKAAKRTGKDLKNLSYEVKDFFKERGKYDVIIFVASLHHFDAKRAAVQIKRLLTPGGLVVADEPCRDLVSARNICLIFLIKGLLSASDSYFQEIELPQKKEEAIKRISDMLNEERYIKQDGSKMQSIMDNSSGFFDLYPTLSSEFEQLEYKKDYAFFHQMIGGSRLKTPEKEHKLARFLKIMDSLLCSFGAIDATNFYYVGRKRC